MIIKTADFLKSSPGIKDCPEKRLPEYSFIGRSNVGKSSLINLLVGNKRLAKISSTPGKTRLVNYFIINEDWYLVDLPGYGYAKSSKKSREKWGKMIHEYLLKRNTLVYTFILVDSRHKPQEIDMDFINWVGGSELPFVLVFTKCDKLSKTELNKNIKAYHDYLYKYWQELPMMFYTSTKDKRGKEDILEFIEKNNSMLSSHFELHHNQE
ncbi:ribosome biogenesis GTP-binding protein YihA/YsxC [Bacteroidota bacterium]